MKSIPELRRRIEAALIASAKLRDELAGEMEAATPGTQVPSAALMAKVDALPDNEDLLLECVAAFNAIERRGVLVNITEASAVPADLWTQEPPMPLRVQHPPANAQPITRITQQYQSLRLGQYIGATDELLNDDCVTWQTVGAWCGGLPYQPNIYRPMRRLISTTLEMHR